MVNPFDAENAEYIVLVNDEGQYSLWPEGIEVPHGWSIVVSKGTRAECLDWIDANWTDMRPKSLTAQLNAAHKTVEQ